MHHIVAIIVAVILSFVPLLLRVASEDRYDRINYIVGYDYHFGRTATGLRAVKGREKRPRAYRAPTSPFALAIIDIYLLS